MNQVLAVLFSVFLLVPIGSTAIYAGEVSDRLDVSGNATVVDFSPALEDGINLEDDVTFGFSVPVDEEDIFPDPSFGRYEGVEMDVTIKGNTASSDSCDLSVQNNRGADQISLDCQTLNTPHPDINGFTHEGMTLVLTDFSQTALDDDSIPLNINLDDFPDIKLVEFSFLGPGGEGAFMSFGITDLESSVIPGVPPPKTETQLVTQSSETGIIPRGTNVKDTATLSGGILPTGTITFNLYQSSDEPTCSAGELIAGPFVVEVDDGNGSYMSPQVFVDFPGKYSWIATYSGDVNNAPSTTLCNDANETFEVAIIAADIVATKTVDKETVPPNGVFTYTIIVENKGPDTAEAVIGTDLLMGPGQFSTLSSTKGSCEKDFPNVFSCELGDMAKDEKITITASVQVDAEALVDLTFNNEFDFRSDITFDPNPDNNRLQVLNEIPTVFGPPLPDPVSKDISIEKKSSVETTTRGKFFLYTITVTNNDPVNPAINVIVEDNVDPDLKIDPAFILEPGCEKDGQHIKCTYDTIPAGESREILLSVQVSDDVFEDKVFNNIAFFNALENPTGFTEISEPKVSTAVLKVSKNAPRVVGDGVSFVYIITVENIGPVDAQNVFIQDNESEGFVLTEPIFDSRCEILGPFPGFPDPRFFRCNVDVLPSGDKITFIATARAQAPDSLPFGDSFTIKNSASARAENAIFASSAVIETILRTGIMNLGQVHWLETSYPVPGTGVLTIIDPDENLDPDLIDIYQVDVISDSDPVGITIPAEETDEDTGIFQLEVPFVLIQSTDTDLQVAPGDKVTGTINDHTVPPGNPEEVKSTTQITPPAVTFPDLKVTKTFESDFPELPRLDTFVFVREEFTYTLEVENIGDAVSVGVTGSDRLIGGDFPPGIIPGIPGIIVTSQGTCDFIPPGEIVGFDCDLGDIEPGKKVTITTRVIASIGVKEFANDQPINSFSFRSSNPLDGDPTINNEGVFTGPIVIDCHDIFPSIVAVEVPVGDDVEVELDLTDSRLGKVKVSFGEVLEPGAFAICVSKTPPGTPIRAQLLGVIFDIATSESRFVLSLEYDDTGISGIQEAGITIKHFNRGTGMWEDIPTVIDSVVNDIAGIVVLASPFGIFAPIDDEIVGGEIIPIETTSLLLSSTQSFSWMIPVVLSGIGIGLFVVSRKSE